MLPEYLPFDGDATRLRMGLRPLDVEDWVEVDDSLEYYLDQKAELFADRRDEVLAFVDDDATLGACQELLDHLVAHLQSRFPKTYVRDGAEILMDGVWPLTAVEPDALHRAGRHPIEAAGRLTAEDWCVMLADGTGAWRMVAGSVCFPTRWVMPAKIGLDLRDLHGPVAFYDQQLASPVERFFDRLEPGVEAGKWRLNWNVVDDPELFQPVPRHQFSASGPHPVESVPERIWLRAERQSLVRLPSTGAVVFGIMVHQDPLGSIAGSTDVLARLASSLRTMTPEAWTYKSLDDYGDAVLEWIDSQLT